MSQITCTISGEILYKSDLLLGFNLADIHPIFKAQKSLILNANIVHSFGHAASNREKKLWYLAVLNTLDLVEFQVPAMPEPWTMEYTFRDLCTLATWVDYARHGKIAEIHGFVEKIVFPRYLVKQDNQRLENISSWISALYDIRKIFLARDLENDVKKHLNQTAQKIEIEFRAAGLINQAFTAPLAKWALDISDCPEDKYAKWKDILQTPLGEAWCLDTREVKEIREYLQLELPVTNDQAIAVLHQIKLLYEATTKGLTAGDWEDEESDEDSGEVKTFQRPKGPIKPNKPEIEYQVLLSETELPPEPQKSEYPKLFQYLAAKANWDLLKAATVGGTKKQYNQF